MNKSIVALVAGLFFSMLSFFSQAQEIVPSSLFSVENKANYSLKPHHKKLQFECVMCHSKAEENVYKKLETNDCLTCHKSKEAVARRTEFMDVNHTNPHNSLHDGLDLDCHECHSEHKPSKNLCSFCHNTENWMNPVP